MDLSTLSLADLKSLFEQIPAEIKRRAKTEKADALKAIEALAAERGFKLDELLDSVKERSVRAPVAAKYRHPAQPELSWSGRGRQPKWVAEFLANGGTMEQITI